MEKVKAKMISYIKNADDKQFQKMVYLGEEIVLKVYSQRNFKFESAEGQRIVRINFQDELKIRETYQNVVIDMKFAENNFGEIKYSQENNNQELSAVFKTRLLDFKKSKFEIFIHYVILDDLLNPLTETKIFLKTGVN